MPCFPSISDGKASACNAGDPSLNPGSGRSPGEGNDNPLQYSCLENFKRSLAGYSPWGQNGHDLATNIFPVMITEPSSIQVQELSVQRGAG